MLGILVTAVNAVVPIVLLILLGYFLRKYNFLSDDFIRIGNKFVFRICLPCMLFINIYDSMDSFGIDWSSVAYCVAMILIFFVFGLVAAVLVTKDRRRRGVILQCAFRSNFAIIGLVLVERLGGDTAIAGIISAFSIPVFNILAVIALSVFVGSGKSGSAPGSKFAEVRGILLNIAKNPLIIGVALGLAFVGVREIERFFCSGAVPFRFDRQFAFLYTAADDLKKIASPFALVVLGGRFKFSAVKGMTKEIIVASLLRIVVAPLLGIGTAVLLGSRTGVVQFGTEMYPTLIALFGTPVAVSSAIMAGQMDNDEQLATQLVVWTSVFSVLTIFVTVFVLMWAGFLVV